MVTTDLGVFKVVCKQLLIVCFLALITACGGGSVSTFSDDDLPSPVVDGIEGDGTVVTPDPGADPVVDDELALLPDVAAGGRQFADPNVLINLIGSATAQGDATITATLWVQVDGPTVTIPNPLSAQNIVVIPDFAEETQLLFQFIAQDSEGRINSATTAVVVQPAESFIRVIGGYVNETSEVGAEFTLRLDEVQTSDLFISYATVSGSAVEGEDFEFTQGTLTLTAGETQATVSVPVFDTEPAETEESFSLQVTVDSADNPASNSGVMVIQNNADFEPIVQEIAFADEGPIAVTVGGIVDNPIIVSTAPGSGELTYLSEDPSIATVDSLGVVTTLSVGSVTITAMKAADPIYSLSTASYEIDVQALLAQNIEFTDAGPITVNVEDTVSNPIFPSSELGTGALVYSSSDETVATVDAAGLVTTLTEGAVTITATKAADSVFAASTNSYDITVIGLALEPPITSTPSPDPFEVDVPGTFVIVNFGGGSLTSCTTTDTLPAGLALVIASNGNDCELTGTPTELQTTATGVSVTLANSAGSSSATIFVSVLVDAPSLDPTPAPNADLEVNIEMTPITFVNEGGGRLTECTAPGLGLPAGLTLAVANNGADCELSGTPTELQLLTGVTILATNVTGTSVTSISIRVSNPISLSISAIKNFDFSFQDLPGVDHYNLLENPDGSSGFSILTSVFLNESLRVEKLSSFAPPAELRNIVEVLPLYSRVNAQYILETCFSFDDSDCYPSDTIDVNDNLAAGVGYIKSSNPDATDVFGDSVAISGDGFTLAIGAPFEDSNAVTVNGDELDNSADSAGAVYTYTRSGLSWVPQDYIKAQNAEAGDEFGRKVALSDNGQVLVVSAPMEDASFIRESPPPDPSDNSEADSGAVYIFGLTSGTWVQEHYLKADNAEAGDQFGETLALSGDGRALVVGAPNESSAATGVDGDDTDNSAPAAGAVYLFQFDDVEGEFWFQSAYVKASNTDAGDEFGSSVTIDSTGFRFAVGASLESSNAQGINGDATDNSAASSGAVYVFETNPIGAIAFHSYIKASNASPGDFFGSAIAMSDNGDILAVGASLEDSNASGIDGDQTDDSLDGAGAAYSFSLVGEDWSQSSYIKASNPDSGDNFGSSLALSGGGGTLVIGAEKEDSAAVGINGDESSNDTVLSGAAYVYNRVSDTWETEAYLKSVNTDAIDSFGGAIDLTTDGSALVIGARNEDSGAVDISGDIDDNSVESSGAVYIY